ncbi:MAG: RNA-binding domain-containing protein [Candidatus Hodarchaeota archaeon]
MSSPQKGLSRIVVHALVHATEDENKVRMAIENLFPQTAQTALKYKRTQLRGHHHNPIIRLEAELTDGLLVTHSVNSIGERLSTTERELVKATLATRTNQKGHLFLRFDKQDSYQGRLRIINQGDSLRLVIQFTGRKMSLNELQNQCQHLNLF